MRILALRRRATPGARHHRCSRRQHAAERRAPQVPTLAPSRYTVYLHPAEFERLETIVPRVLQDQTLPRRKRRRLRRLNAASATHRWKRPFAGEPKSEVRNAASDWHITFLADPDEELQEGDLFVDSELLMPARPDLGLGAQTEIVTRQTGQSSSTLEHTIAFPAALSTPRLLARIEYDDEAGHHFYDVTRDCVNVRTRRRHHPVDLRIASSADVSLPSTPASVGIRRVSGSS